MESLRAQYEQMADANTSMSSEVKKQQELIGKLRQINSELASSEVELKQEIEKLQVQSIELQSQLEVATLKVGKGITHNCTCEIIFIL